MGLKDWRTRHGMKDPVRGEFHVSGSYYPHPGSTPIRTMLTGVIVAEGVAPTPAEHLDRHVLGEFRESLPALVDRAEPTRSLILWDEVTATDYRAEARARAQADAQRLGGTGTTGTPAGPVAPNGALPTTGTPPRTEVVTDLADLPPWLQKAVGAALEDDDAGPFTVQHGTDVHTINAAPASGWAPAPAVLASVTDVAVPAYALPGPTASLCDLLLQVSRADGSSYPVSTRMGFRDADRRARLAVLVPVVPVVVDPSDETHLTIDIAAWDAARGSGQPGRQE